MRPITVALLLVGACSLASDPDFGDNGTEPPIDTGNGGGDDTGGDDTGTDDTGTPCTVSDLEFSARATDDGQPQDEFQNGDVIEVIAQVFNPCATALSFDGGYDCLVPRVALRNEGGSNEEIANTDNCDTVPTTFSVQAGQILAVNLPVGPIDVTSDELTVVATFANGALAVDNIQIVD